MKRLISCCVIVLLQLIAVAQERYIQGWIKMPDGKTLPNVTVTLKNEKDIILHFTRTNAEGNFIFRLMQNQLDAVTVIEVNHIGFQKTQQKIVAGQNQYTFQLQVLYVELSTVKVKNRPTIISKGDTLSYNVRSFAREEDRSIGDVIKRMPGIVVDDEGRIYYNDKLISNLYIHGDDLMDGRYGLATKTITKEMIESVDVIQHHQPVAALQGKVSSDKVSVNLVLKDENKLSLSTQAMLGMGLPKQYDATLSTILLNKKIKVLNAAKVNNSGVDYRSDFSQLGSTSMLEDINATDPEALLSSGTVSPPDLPRRNYYLNRSAAININQLFKNKKAVQFKTNVQAFIDRNALSYQSNTRLQLNDETVHYREQQQAINRFRAVQASLSIMDNKPTHFLNNRLSFLLQRNKGVSTLVTDKLDFGQQLAADKYSFTNDLSLVPATKTKAIIELRWLLKYSNDPQRLQIDTGLHQGIVNADIPYTMMMQEASVPTLFSTLSASYLRTNGLIKQNYTAGLLTERQELNSLLLLQQNNGIINHYERDAGNALRWQKDRLYVQANYNLQQRRYEIGLTLPLIAQHIRYRQADYVLDKRRSHFLITPSARIKWLLPKEDYLLLNYTYTNNPGTISGVYRGVVLTSYRSLHASDADLQQVNRSNASLFYNFQRSITMLFMSAGVQYTRSQADFIYSSVITDSVQRVVLLPYTNMQEGFSIVSSFSKYLFSVGGTIGLKIVYQKSRYNQLINDLLLPYDSRSITLAPSWQGRLLGKINFSYDASIMHNRTNQKQNKNRGTSVQQMDQQAGVGFSILRKMQVQAKARHIYSKQSGVEAINYVFADATLRYRHIKWRTDFELDASNLFGIKTYEIYRQNTNISSQSIYQIRGRMLLLRATFTL